MVKKSSPSPTPAWNISPSGFPLATSDAHVAL
jgi:hypothetical protein